MLLHFIVISAVVCTVEISEFHSVFPPFLCLSRLLEKLSAVSLDAWDNFYFPFVVVSLSMQQIRGSCGHLKGEYDNHSSCLNCSGCYRFHCCAVCHCWLDATWALVSRRRLFRDKPMGKTKEAKVKKPRNSASRNSSSSRPGVERAVSQVDPSGSTADGPDDDSASVLSRSSSGGERGRGNTQVSSKHSSHGTPGPKSPARRPTQRSTPARSQPGDLAGKYGARTISQVIPSGSNSVDDGPSPPPGDSTLGTLSQDRSPRSESKRPVERPSSCDTGHNAWLATKVSVQQSPVNGPVYSEHAPVTPGPGKSGNGPLTGTRDRDPVPGTRLHRTHRVNWLQ